LAFPHRLYVRVIVLITLANPHDSRRTLRNFTAADRDDTRSGRSFASTRNGIGIRNAGPPQSRHHERPQSAAHLELLAGV
jgi:hypothetical protein